MGMGRGTSRRTSREQIFSRIVLRSLCLSLFHFRDKSSDSVVLYRPLLLKPSLFPLLSSFPFPFGRGGGIAGPNVEQKIQRTKRSMQIIRLPKIPFRQWSAVTRKVRWLAIMSRLVTSFTSGSLLLLVSSCAPSSHTTVVTNLHNYSHVLLCKRRHTVWDCCRGSCNLVI